MEYAFIPLSQPFVDVRNGIIQAPSDLAPKGVECFCRTLGIHQYRYERHLKLLVRLSVSLWTKRFWVSVSPGQERLWGYSAGSDQGSIT